MKDKEKAQDIATQRAMLIAPLLSHGLDRGEAKLIKERICRETGLSERTIRRYLSDYQKKGFSGVKRLNLNKYKSINCWVIALQAILLRMHYNV